MRDIDRIVHLVQEGRPDVTVRQLAVTHPADDDGLWFFDLPALPGKVQIESPYGECPFLIEDRYDDERKTGRTPEQTAEIVLKWLAR